MKRRTVLKQASAVAGTIAAAGCLSEGAGGGEEGESTTESDGGDGGSGSTAMEETTTTAAVAMAGKSVETTDAGCGSENSATVAFGDSGASVEGKIPVNNPCHEAAFASAELSDGALTVVMEAVETDADACQQCLAAVSYSAGVETSNGVPDSVTVKHRARGETTVVAEASR